MEVIRGAIFLVAVDAVRIAGDDLLVIESGRSPTVRPMARYAVVTDRLSVAVILRTILLMADGAAQVTRGDILVIESCRRPTSRIMTPQTTISHPLMHFVYRFLIRMTGGTIVR